MIIGKEINMLLSGGAGSETPMETESHVVSMACKGIIAPYR